MLGIIAGVVVLAVVVSLIVAGATRMSDEDKIARCPEVVRDLISAQIGEPSDFARTDLYPGNQMKGTATVRGFEYVWICSIGITRGNRVQVDVRDSEQSSVILEYVDL